MIQAGRADKCAGLKARLASEFGISAYVLCSLKETRSVTAIEQIVGRILRLPGATPKAHPDLNCAYAFSVSDSMPQVLSELRQALESNGFSSAEAERIVLPASQATLGLGIRPQRIQVDPATEIDLAVSDQRALNFRNTGYQPSWLYEGGHQFKKHYFGPKPGELRENKADGKPTEEFLCACHLDAHPSIRWWVRNLSQKPTSFRLQNSKQWFYPDFVCQLVDERILVVEYKGKHLWDEAAENRAVGMVWEARSRGRCLFVMPTAGDLAVIDTKITD